MPLKGPVSCPLLLIHSMVNRETERQKTKLSKKILSSNSGNKTVQMMKTLETVEKELELSYKNMRMKREKEALNKIKRNPRYFYSYAKRFSKIREKVGPLLNEEGETVSDPFLMAEVLRKQYESAFSSPDPEFNMETMGDFFSLAERNEEQRGENEEERRDDVEERRVNEEVGGDNEEEGREKERRPDVRYPPLSNL